VSGQTPSQTVGPFFTLALSGEGENVLVRSDTPGQHIRLQGVVVDGDGAPFEDALVEIWQADHAGRYRHPDDEWGTAAPGDGFLGFGRAASDFTSGLYWFETIKPGPVPHPGGGVQAPHISLVVQARGMLNPSFTRVYFSDEGEANRADPVLRGVPEDRRATLIARRREGGDRPTYDFDIRFQGAEETVFFDV
jgi:protocatechuate 3,4-dioxygenase, alpha subunit